MYVFKTFWCFFLNLVSQKSNGNAAEILCESKKLIHILFRGWEKRKERKIEVTYQTILMGHDGSKVNLNLFLFPIVYSYLLIQAFHSLGMFFMKILLNI